MPKRATTASDSPITHLESLSEFRRSLLHWYDAHGRDLPWRRTRDPYAIWVSEVMLQQTRVETVIPYYERFLSRFPTVEALADAPEDEVLALWSGLGYYSRARNLRHGATVVRDDHGGRFPRDPDLAGGLPGVGPYTRAAVLSIAYDAPLAVVDGNVARVLSRLFRLDIRVGQIDASMRRLAQDLLERERPAQWNQAMMELGARVCTPRQPACGECPIQRECLAYATQEVLAFPRPKTKRKPVDLAFDLFLLRDREERLLLERGQRRLLDHLWLPPLREVSGELEPAINGVSGGNRSDAAGERWFTEGDVLAALRIGDLEYCGRVRHSVTHHRIEVRVWCGSFDAPAEDASAERAPVRWDAERHRLFTLTALRGVAVSSLLTKALRCEAQYSSSTNRSTISSSEIFPSA